MIVRVALVLVVREEANKGRLVVELVLMRESVIGCKFVLFTSLRSQLIRMI